MTSPTTIKVPRDLRDRIAARAARDGTTLAAAIARALDVSEEEEFWAKVAADHARAAPDEYDDGTLRDHLDPADDALRREDW